MDDCSSDVEDAITDALGISSTRETALISQEADTLLKLDASQALRDERNDVSIQIFGIRKIIGEENDKVDKLERLKVFLDNSTITDVVE